MWIAVQLAYHHYAPEELQVGMMFMNHLNMGTEKELIELFRLDKNQLTFIDQNDLIDNHGYPVRPFIIDEDGKILITPEEIGWFDPGGTSTKLIPLDLEEFNFIMREFDGILEMFVDGEQLEKGQIEPVTSKHNESGEDWAMFRFLQDDKDIVLPEYYVKVMLDNTISIYEQPNLWEVIGPYNIPENLNLDLYEHFNTEEEALEFIKNLN